MAWNRTENRDREQQENLELSVCSEDPLFNELSDWMDQLQGIFENTDPFREKEKWIEIGEKLKLSRMEMPSSIGRPPRDIYKYNAGFKAVEWRNWILFFSLPILKDLFNNV